MDEIIRAVVTRLTEKGMDLTRIPGYMQNLVNVLSTGPGMSAGEANAQMLARGWEGFDLDEHTFQLVLILLTIDVTGDHQETPLWFEVTQTV